MARLPRLALPGHMHHVLLRGNNRQAIFIQPKDYIRLLDLLPALARRHGCSIHAYVLLESSMHLLLTPREAQSLPKCMQALGRSYVRYFNQVHDRSGTLWEGRYRACIVEPQHYAIACMVLFDRSPVQAGLAPAPHDYPWSSHAHYAGTAPTASLTPSHTAWLQPPAAYWSLGNTPFAREAAYTHIVQTGLNAFESARLLGAVEGGWALGENAFLAALQEQTPRRITPGKPGRPRRSPQKPAPQ